MLVDWTATNISCAVLLSSLNDENLLAHLVKVINTGHCINMACHQSELAPSLHSKSVLDQQMQIPISSFQEAGVNYRQQCYSTATHSLLGLIHQVKRQYLKGHTHKLMYKHKKTCMAMHEYTQAHMHIQTYTNNSTCI